jgi:hypothetical protein
MSQGRAVLTDQRHPGPSRMQGFLDAPARIRFLAGAVGSVDSGTPADEEGWPHFDSL